VKLKNNAAVATASSYLYARAVVPWFRAPSVDVVRGGSFDSAELPVALVCDEMTWQNISRVCRAVFLPPVQNKWREVLQPGKVRLFLCEAAWSGINQGNSCWRGQIYKDRRVRFGYENRRELLRLLEHCKKSGIPTVFWAKEDPAYFCGEIYDFTDTALRFDHILTTAEECVAEYAALGHKSAHLWAFGFSEEIFYPPESPGLRERAAVFAGSWFADHPQRCADTTEMFDYITGLGIPLIIYDRNRSGGRSSKPFPEKYQQYVRDSVAYESLGEIYRGTEYAVNINTTRDSVSMFARRVYEIMACGAIVISNDSAGMRAQFGSRVWYAGENFDFERADEIRRENIGDVFAKHTNAARMAQLWDIAASKN